MQANKTTHKNPVSKYGAQWITQIRQMETTGQTMGLDEKLNGLNATEENGIDVHMMLPTEYEAVAILSASGYGNPGKLRDETDAQKRTTTGNSTGVYYTGDRGETLANYNSAKVSKYLKSNSEIESFLNSVNTWHDGSKVAVWGSTQPVGTNSPYRVDPCFWCVGTIGVFSGEYVKSNDSATGGGRWAFNAWDGSYISKVGNKEKATRFSRGSVTI